MPDLHMISEPVSQKFAIKLTVKGRPYILTKIEERFALIPLVGSKAAGAFLGFDTREDAQKLLDEIRAKYPVEFDKIWEMKPDIIPVNPIQ